MIVRMVSVQLGLLTREHYLVQQHLGGRGVSTISEAILSRGSEALLQALAPLDSSEKLSIVRSPEATACSAVEVRDTSTPLDLALLQ